MDKHVKIVAKKGLGVATSPRTRPQPGVDYQASREAIKRALDNLARPCGNRSSHPRPGVDYVASREAIMRALDNLTPRRGGDSPKDN